MTNSKSSTTANPPIRRLLVEYKARSKMGDTSSRLLQLKNHPFDDRIGNIRQLDQALGEEFIGMPESGEVLEPLFSENDIRGLELPVQLPVPPKLKGFDFSKDQTPVIMGEPEAIIFGAPMSGGELPRLRASTTYVMPAKATDEAISVALESPDIIAIWDAPEIIHFNEGHFQNPKPLPPKIQACALSTNLSNGDNGTAVGTFEDMLSVLEIERLHQQRANGTPLTGHGVTVGVMDFGINVNFDDKWPIKNITDGYPPLVPNSKVKKWGTISYPSTATPHANHVSFVITAIAPAAHIHDYRISNGSSPSEKAFLDEALAALHDAVERFRTTGQPKILNCSWGIYYHLKKSDYATNPNHPVARKFIEAIQLGMIIVFAAGNCGAPCSSPNVCFTKGGTVGSFEYYPTTGPGVSILGMNGHEDIISVVGATTKKEYITYSSQGPAIMPPHGNPDICGMSHFQSYRDENFSGTSCAAPVISGIIALMIQKHPRAVQAQIKQALIQTADSEPFKLPASNAAYTGHGLVNPIRALEELDRIMAQQPSAIA